MFCFQSVKLFSVSMNMLPFNVCLLCVFFTIWFSLNSQFWDQIQFDDSDLTWDLVRRGTAWERSFLLLTVESDSWIGGRADMDTTRSWHRRTKFGIALWGDSVLCSTSALHWVYDELSEVAGLTES